MSFSPGLTQHGNNISIIVFFFEFTVVWVRCQEEKKKSKFLNSWNGTLSTIEKCETENAIENVATEGYGYLDYIVKNYPNFPSFVIFLHGIPEQHNDNLNSSIYNFINKIQLTRKNNMPWCSFSERYVANRMLFKNDVGRGLEEFYKLKVSQKIPDLRQKNIFFPCCSTFVVSKELLLSFSLRDYNELKNLAVLPIKGKSKYGKLFHSEIGVIYEHIWHLLWSKSLIDDSFCDKIFNKTYAPVLISDFR